MRAIVCDTRSNRLKIGLVIGIVCLFAVGLFLYPEGAIIGTRYGLDLCTQTVIPSLFPFMVLSVFLVKCPVGSVLFRPLGPIVRHLFRLPDEVGTAVVMGLIGGFPVGAQTLNALVQNEKISRPQAARALLFLVNAGPAFTVGAVGVSMLGNAQAGLLLFGSVVTSSLLFGFVSARFARKTQPCPCLQINSPQRTCGYAEAFVASVHTAGRSLFYVCWFILLFSCIIHMLNISGLPNYLVRLLTAAGVNRGTAAALLPSLLEVTAGCDAITQSGFLFLPVYAFWLSFGGLSVHFQVFSCTTAFDFSKTKFFLARLCCAALSAFLAYVFALAFPMSAFSFAQGTSLSPTLSSSPPAAAALLLCLGIFMLSGKNTVDFAVKKCYDKKKIEKGWNIV